MAPAGRPALRSLAAAALLALGALSPAAWAEGAPSPRPVFGPTLSTGHTLARGAPAPVALGLQTIVPKGALRLIGEVFLSSPGAAFTPALGGDVAVGLVNDRGLGGALGAYGRRTLGADGAPGSTQVGPAALMLAKVSPGLFIGTPVVLWIDPAAGTLTPTLTVKLILGLPVGG